MQPLKKTEKHVIILLLYIAGSSNGRTRPFEGWYLGSSPSPAASLLIKNLCQEK